MTHPLDNVIWSALTSHQAGVALGGALARRYQPGFAPLAALSEPSGAAFDELAKLLAPGQQVVLLTAAELAVPEAFEVLMRREVVQMLAPAAPGAPPASADARIAPLGAGDLPEMLTLVKQAQPGPFGARGAELGRFLGIRIDGRLAAMAGERLRLSGYTEVSAVCTDPAFRGQGLARELILAASAGIVARGERPFLHVLRDNVSAIALYLKLGFTERAAVRMTLLRPS